ncbi:MAG: hypothetical protein WBP29_15255 [Candidatus Zixiibacteriota bacterium]
MSCLKRTWLFLSIAIIQMFFVSASFAATYYVRTDGNDANNGLTWATAWRSVAKVNNTIVAGDQVRFGTGRWLGTALMPPTGGTANTRTVYACSTFTPDTRGRAIISGGELVTGWTVYSGSIYRASWTPATGYYNASDGRKSYTLSQNDVLLNPQRTLTDVNAPGEFFHDPTSNVIYAYLWNGSNPASQSMVASSRPAFWVRRVNTDHILCYGLDFRMGKGGTVLFEETQDLGSNNVAFEHCNISRASFMELENSAVIFVRGAFTSPSYDSVNINDYVRYLSFKSCSIGVATAEPTPVIAHRGSGVIFYDATNTFFDSCAFYDLPGDGFECKNSYATGCTKCIGAQHTIRYSTFENIGGKAFDIYSNGFRDSLYGCVIINANEGSAWFGGNATLSNYGEHFVCNNTIYRCNNSYVFELPYPVSSSMGKFRYNVVYDLEFDGIDQRAFVASLGTANFPSAAIDSNFYFDPSNSFFAMADYSGTLNWSQWRGLGFDTHSLNTNPGLINPAGSDFSRPLATQEMNVTYGGRNWTRFGAWQPAGSGCTLPSVPALSSPLDGVTGLLEPVLIDWADVATASSYQVQIDNNSDFSSPITDQVVPVSNYSASGLTIGVSLHWRVRAVNACGWGNWSASRSFLISCSTAAAPALISPASGAANLSSPVALDWSEVSLALAYQVQVDNNSDFSSPAIDRQTLPLASNYSATGLASSITYYWRVRTQNLCGWGGWAAARSFTIGACASPAQATLASPANGASGLSQPIYLDWNDVATATNYQVQIDNNSDFTSTAIDQQTANSAYSASGLTAASTFYWRARAQNGCGWGSWSASRSLMTSAPDVTAPTFSAVTASNIGDNSALIIWLTNESSSTQINYGTTTSYGSTSTLNSTLVTSHSQTLLGLSPTTTYHYRVRSRDAAGNEAVSGDYTFTTTEALGNLDNGITPSVSSTYPGYSTARITDGVLNPFGGFSSTWSTAESSTAPHWIEIDFGASRVVKRVVIYWAWNPVQQRWMTSQQFKLQAWGGSAYNDVTVINNPTLDSCTVVSIVPTATTKFRYYQSANMGPSTYPLVVWVSELELLGTDNTAPSVPALASPAAGTVINTQYPTLTISNSVDAEGNAIRYNFQVSLSPTFTSVVTQTTEQVPGGTNSTSWVVPVALANGTTYYWRAYSFDGSLYSGFSSPRSFQISPTAASFVCGDSDATGIITISDAVYLINFIFSGGSAPIPLLAGDSDCNSVITISDAVYLINYIFVGGTAPCASC